MYTLECVVVGSPVKIQDYSSYEAIAFMITALKSTMKGCTFTAFLYYLSIIIYDSDNCEQEADFGVGSTMCHSLL